MFRKIIQNKAFKYLISGIVGAGTNLGVLFVSTHFLHIWYVVSSIAGFTISCIVSFFFQKFWTFEDVSKDTINKQFIMYGSLLIVGNLLNVLLITWLVEYAHFNYVLAQCVSIFVLAIINFLIYDKIIFYHGKTN